MIIILGGAREEKFLGGEVKTARCFDQSQRKGKILTLLSEATTGVCGSAPTSLGNGFGWVGETMRFKSPGPQHNTCAHDIFSHFVVFIF